MDNELRDSLNFSGDIVSGEVSLSEAKLISVPAKEHYNSVDICIEDTVNIAVAEIHCNWLDYQNKVALGAEIEKRWNAYQEIQPELDALKAENQRLKSALTKCKEAAGNSDADNSHAMDMQLCDIWTLADEALGNE